MVLKASGNFDYGHSRLSTSAYVLVMITERSIIELLQQQDIAPQSVFCGEGGEINVVDIVKGISFW